MRIISKQHDYYDCIQSLGQDQNIVYVREPSVECQKCHKLAKPDKRRCSECKEILEPVCRTCLPIFKGGSHWRYSRSDNHILYIDQHIVGVCGKIYPIFELYATTNQNSAKPAFCVNVEEVDDFIKANFKPVQFENYKSSKRSFNRGDLHTPILRKDVVQYFKECETNKENYEHIFIENKVPIFISTIRSTNNNIRGNYKHGSNKTMTYNANLADVKFYRVMDPQTLFQEIYMYMAGVLCATMERGKPTYQGQKMSSEVSDKDLAAAKGYDKWSFRKEPKKMRK